VIYFTDEEWQGVREKLIMIAPKALLILLVFMAGVSFGWHTKGNDVTMDCKYSGSFRFHTDSFKCVRQL
jgi:hypothetical protein